MSSKYTNEALRNLNTEDDFKNYFVSELIEEKDPYLFSSTCNGRFNDDYYPGLGIYLVYRSLLNPKETQLNIPAEEVSKKLDLFLDAVVDCLTDTDLFYKKTEKKFLGPGAETSLFGIDLWQKTMSLRNKNDCIAQKLFSHVLLEDLLSQKIDKNSSNFKQQYYLMRAYFDFLPVEKYDFETIDKLSLNPSLSLGMFQVLLDIDQEKAKNLALSAIKKGVKSKDLELSLKDYFPGITF